MPRKPRSLGSTTPSEGTGSGSHEKVCFRLVRDEDDYPPADVEGIWCMRTAEVDVLVVDNIPFFTRQATLGDTIRVRRLASGELEIQEVIAKSAHSLLRLVVYDRADIQSIRDELSRLGCSTELMADSRLVAVDVPDEASLADVQRYLERLEADEKVGYEEPILRHPKERSLR